MQIKSLKNFPLEDLVTVFNVAFSDYIIPIKLTLQQFQDKLFSEDISLEWSYGAFLDTKLIGFVLHGYRNTTLYNAGTGVIPEYRGTKITKFIYAHILPFCKEKQIEQIILEVITDNKVAQSIYQSVGFKNIRTVHCYKGMLNLEKNKSSFEITEIKTVTPFKIKQANVIYFPTWQNSEESINKLNLVHTIKCIEARHQGKCIASLVFDTNNKKILTISIAPEFYQTTVLKDLFLYVQQNFSKEVLIINIDTNFYDFHSQFLNFGLSCFLKQFEMKWDLI